MPCRVSTTLAMTVANLLLKEIKMKNLNLLRIIRAKETAERLGVSRRTLARMEEAGIFPKRKQIGPNCVGWLFQPI